MRPLSKDSLIHHQESPKPRRFCGPNPSANFAIWHSASDVQLTADQENLQILGGIGDHIQIESSTDLRIWDPLLDRGQNPGTAAVSDVVDLRGATL